MSARNKIDRRQFLKQTAAAAAMTAGLAGGPIFASSKASALKGKKVIVIGIDGMDPTMCEELMNAGTMPNFDRLRRLGGFSRLGTSIPPLSAVAWANFINGAGPGYHGIFGFNHRDPAHQCEVFNAISRVQPGEGIRLGGYMVPLTFWPFNQQAPEPILNRQGTPFWNYLDTAGIPSAVYYMPSNYPPSRSPSGHHQSLAGLGTPDLLGSKGKGFYFADDLPEEVRDDTGFLKCRLNFVDETARVMLYGPQNMLEINKKHASVEIAIHRDRKARAAVIEVQGRKILLNEGQWSDWVALDFVLPMPVVMPDEHISGICRFYLQRVSPGLRLYVTPININPANPAARISEPEDFSRRLTESLGLFYTTGWQEDFQARDANVFDDEEFVAQAEDVLNFRMKLLDYGLEHYREGLFFFYFSSLDLLSHFFWWDTNKKHPVRPLVQVLKYRNYLKDLYRRMDRVVGDILHRYGDEALVMVLSDHGFGYSDRRFNLNVWLRENGYIQPDNCTTLFTPKDTDIFSHEADWSKTTAYGIGLNNLYLNLEGRERYGIVTPAQRQELLNELVTRLEAVRDVDGSPVIKKVYRADEVYAGAAMALAPDLILGYHRGYRTTGNGAEGKLDSQVFCNEPRYWFADHCMAADEVPGILFCNREIRRLAPSLIDLAPAILAEFSLDTPPSMVGRNVFRV